MAEGIFHAGDPLSGCRFCGLLADAACGDFWNGGIYPVSDPCRHKKTKGKDGGMGAGGWSGRGERSGITAGNGQAVRGAKGARERQEKSHEHYQVFISQFPFLETGESPVQLLTRLQDKAAEYRRLSAREQELRDQRECLTGQIEEKTDSVRKRLGTVHVKYGMEKNLREACENLRKDGSEYDRLEQELEKSRAELREFEKNNEEVWQKAAEQSKNNPFGEEELSPEELQKQGKQCESEIEKVDVKIHSYRKDMDALSVIVDRQTEIEEELENLKSELKDAEYRAGILEKTMQYLKEAKESFSHALYGSYAPWIFQVCGDIRRTGGK